MTMNDHTTDGERGDNGVAGGGAGVVAGGGVAGVGQAATERATTERPAGVDDELIFSIGNTPPLQTTWDDVQRLAQLLAGLPVAIIATDAMGTVLIGSAHAATMYGWTADEALGRPITELTVGPTDQDTAAAIMASVTSGNVWEGEFTATRRDGTEVHIHIIDAPILGSVGEIIGVIGVSVDVSAQRDKIRDNLRRVRDASLRSLVEVDVERRRIAMELHDDVGQTLTALRSELLWLRDRPADEVRATIERLDQAIGDGIDRVRRVCEDLRPRLIHELGLEESLRIMTADTARRIGAEPYTHVEQLPLLTPYAAMAVYRATQECLTNIERHAATSAQVVCVMREVPSSASFDEPCVELQVSSDGGTYGGQMGHGLSLMRDRFNAIGGTVTVEGLAGGGVQVTAVVPTVLAFAPEATPDDGVERRGHLWYLTSRLFGRDPT
ncbi:MAG: PAS domain-containing protein [Ilumatobacteraceae bacterium]